MRSADVISRLYGSKIGCTWLVNDNQWSLFHDHFNYVVVIDYTATNEGAK
jgi:hypothetical protein